MEKKERNDRVQKWDIGKEKRVHNGRREVKVLVESVHRRGVLWGSRVQTKKACTKGADPILAKKGKKAMPGTKKK